MPTHGSHWSCLYPDVNVFGQEQLPKLLKGLPLLHQQGWTNAHEIPKGEKVDRLAVFCEQNGPIRHMVIVLGHSVLRNNFLFSAYPAAVDTTEVSLRILRLEPWEYGVEGYVVAEIEDQGEMTFFDPWFFINRNRYRIGEVNRIRLAAFAYVVKSMGQEYVQIDDPERAAVLREQLNMPANEPVRFLMTDFVARFPQEPADDCGFASPIKDIKPCEANGFALRKAKIALARGYDDIDAPLYIGAHTVAEGLDLRLGAQVQGAYWLQGYLAESHSLFLGN